MVCLYYALYCPEVEIFTALFKNRADTQVFAVRVVKTVIEMNIDEQWGQVGMGAKWKKSKRATQRLGLWMEYRGRETHKKNPADAAEMRNRWVGQGGEMGIILDLGEGRVVRT